MNRQSQWLFEAPVASEATLYTNPYSDPEWDSPPLCPGISKFAHKARTLKVPFRKDFGDFLREVERAVGRWTVYRSDRGQRVRRLLKPWIVNLRSIYKSNLDAKVPSGVPIDIVVNFYYAGKGESLRVCEILIPVPEVINVKEYEWENSPKQQQRSVSIQDEIAWERANPNGGIEQNSDGCLVFWNFAVGSAALKSNHQQRLIETARRQIDRMRFDPTAFISIEGHTSPTGSATRNQQISERRARAVKAFLVARGLSASQIVAVGAGASSPLVPNTTAENMARNRRVVICIAQLT